MTFLAVGALTNQHTAKKNSHRFVMVVLYNSQNIWLKLHEKNEHEMI